MRRCFNTQPPEGGWGSKNRDYSELDVSTHSRLKAAGYALMSMDGSPVVSTHSRLKAAG